MKDIKSVIFGLSSLTLSLEEQEFFRKANPLGFILFKRNCQDKQQIKALIKSLQNCLNREYIPILIDQEGGRVARLRPPNFMNFPAAKIFADLAETDIIAATKAAYLNGQLIGYELANLGINFDCAPVADLYFKDAHTVIGDRSYGSEVQTVIELANITAKALNYMKVEPITKHIPGHGRAKADSHHTLPSIDTTLEELMNSDFKVFKNLNHIKWTMTAHVVYSCLDQVLPATFSKITIDFIRKELNYQDNIIITDDLGMNALSGSLRERAEKSLIAGCDVLLGCSGEINHMQEIAEITPAINNKVQQFLLEKKLKQISDFDIKQTLAELKTLINHDYMEG